jgi:hypothetical protein
MMNTRTNHEQRDLCAQRDKEFLELYCPTLDMMIEQGVPHPQMAAVVFTITNGRPHYHVDLENAYRRVCHMLKAEEKARHNARTYDPETEVGLANDRLRRKMWVEITGRVRELLAHGMSVERATEHVLSHCRATRFFITPSTALTKICTKARSRAIR